METEQSSPLGSLLLSTRKRANLTQELLAERAAVSVNTISNLEAGRAHLPRQATLNLLVNALASELALTPAEQASFRTAFREATLATRVQRQGADPEQPAALSEGAGSPVLPTGTLTFLVCAFVNDADGTTERSPAGGIDLLRLAALLQKCIPPRHGRLLDPPDAPDGAVAVFSRMPDALTAACALQQALADDVAGVVGPVCLALHTGRAEPGEGEYDGPTRRHAVRLSHMGHGSQLLLSQQSWDMARSTVPEGVRLREVGRHSLSVLERPQPIYQIVPASAPTGVRPLRPLRTPPTNLPLQMTNFIGRERERVVIARLSAQAPLVTLVGTGGCGKTRLALQAAADLLEEYPDGIRLVELAGLSGTGSGGAALVCRAVADALGVREESGRPLLATLLDALRPKRVMLVLDNCEHLIAACAELVAALLRDCPHLQILATSRERLAIRGETTYRVPSLSLPEPGRQYTATAATSYAGVRLFVERAHAVLPEFALTEENVGTIVRICRQLAGIPLAIELAAAAAARLPLQTIAARLEQSIGVLTDGPRDVLPRHQTLRAALDWSWTLLSEHERVLLRRLSVFAGGWRPGAAVAVCSGNGIADWAVSDLLDGLANKSLAMLDVHNAVTRYGMLETVRQYAAEQLTEAGEQATARDRHLDWCVALAEEAAGRLNGPEQGMWLARLEREHDNLRAALTWAHARTQETAALRLAGALWRFWLTRGYLSEGRGWLEEALSGMQEAPSGIRANALTGAGVLAGQQGDYGQAATRFEEALTLRRALGDARPIADSLNNLALLAKGQGDHERSEMLHDEVLTLFRAMDYKPGIARALTGLGNAVLRQGDDKRAAALHEEALTLYRLLEDTEGMARTLGNLGNVLHKQGDYDRAAALHEEALALQRLLGDKIGITRSLHNVGAALYERADYGRTASLLAEAFPLLRDLGDREILAEGLELAAWVTVAQGQISKAAQLSGAAETLRKALDVPLTPGQRIGHEQAVRNMRATLGEKALAAAWAEGQAMPLEQAITIVQAAGQND